MIPPIDPSLRATLRARAEALAVAGECAAQTEFGLVWGVSRKCVRAYVWASHRGRDPAPEIARIRYGTTELGDGGWRDVRAVVARLASIENPKRAGAEARPQERLPHDHP